MKILTPDNEWNIRQKLNNITTMHNEDDIKKQIVLVARRVLDERIDLIEGCRQLVRLYHCLREDEIDPYFSVIIGFESDTDMYPTGESRELYKDNYLKELDQGKEQSIKRSKNLIYEACAQIISRFEVVEGFGKRDKYIF